MGSYASMVTRQITGENKYYLLGWSLSNTMICSHLLPMSFKSEIILCDVLSRVVWYREIGRKEVEHYQPLFIIALYIFTCVTLDITTSLLIVISRK